MINSGIVKKYVAPKPKQRKRRDNPEDRLQTACVQWLRLQFKDKLFYFHCPNGGKRTKAEAAMFKRLRVLQLPDALSKYHTVPQQLQHTLKTTRLRLQVPAKIVRLLIYIRRLCFPCVKVKKSSIVSNIRNQFKTQGNKKPANMLVLNAGRCQVIRRSKNAYNYSKCP